MENKDHGNPKACVHIHAYAHAYSSSTYACFMHAYAYMGMRMHVKVPETMKYKFSILKFGFWNESHIICEPFQTLIFEL